jgi:hypothetical protein
MAGPLATIVLVPIPRRGQQLQPDGEGVYSQRFAVNYPGAGAEIAGEGAHIQTLIRLPGPAGNNARSMGADILREGFLHPLPDIEAAEINSYGERNTVFEALRQNLHGTPLELSEW